VVLPQPNLIKFKLEYLKSDFKCKKKDISTDEKLFASFGSPFFEFSLSLLLKCGRSAVFWK